MLGSKNIEKLGDCSKSELLETEANNNYCSHTSAEEKKFTSQINFRQKNLL